MNLGFARRLGPPAVEDLSLSRCGSSAQSCRLQALPVDQPHRSFVRPQVPVDFCGKTLRFHPARYLGKSMVIHNPQPLLLLFN